MRAIFSIFVLVAMGAYSALAYTPASALLNEVPTTSYNVFTTESVTTDSPDALFLELLLQGCYTATASYSGPLGEDASATTTCCSNMSEVARIRAENRASSLLEMKLNQQ